TEEQAGFGIFGGSITAAGRAEAERRRGILGEGVGLARQGEIEEGFAEGLGQAQRDVFEGREGGAPGRPIRAVTAVGQVFGRAFEQAAAIVHLTRRFFGAAHPWLLKDVPAIPLADFSPKSNTSFVFNSIAVVRPRISPPLTPTCARRGLS